MTRRVALIGYGSVARSALRCLAEAGENRVLPAGMLVLPGHQAQAEAVIRRTLPPTACPDGIVPFPVVESLDALLDLRPDMVAECAGRDAAATYGVPILHSGSDLLIISTSVFADQAWEQALRQAALTAGRTIRVPAGAIGGIDALAAMRLGGLDRVLYRSVKPPAAWRDTPADRKMTLESLTEPTIVYEGTARAAARDFPKNANVAATIALAGLGFEGTRVSLVADPTTSRNTHHVEAVGWSGQFEIALSGIPSPDNPKTSALTGLSVARALGDLGNSIVL